jgi:hypothetical protein
MTEIILRDKDGTQKDLYEKGKRYINNVERPNVISYQSIFYFFLRPLFKMEVKI